MLAYLNCNLGPKIPANIYCTRQECLQGSLQSAGTIRIRVHCIFSGRFLNSVNMQNKVLLAKTIIIAPKIRCNTFWGNVESEDLRLLLLYLEIQDKQSHTGFSHVHCLLITQLETLAVYNNCAF